MTTPSLRPGTPVSLQSLPLTFLWKEALAFLACMAIMKVGGSVGGVLVGVLLLGWSLRNATSAMQALTLLVPLSALNPALIPANFSGMLKWLVIFAASGVAAIRCVGGYAGHRQLLVPRWVLALLLFVVVTALVSVAVSGNAVVSVFKLASFTVGVVGVMAIFWDRSISLRYCLSWFYTLFVVVLAVSLPLALLPIGYFPGTRYFQGLLNQSQAYGIYIVPFTAFLLAKWIYLRAPISVLERFASLGGIATIYLSNSRTAGLALVGATALSLLVGVAHGAIDRHLLLRRIIPALAVLSLLLLVVEITSGGVVQRMVEGYIHKGGSEVNTVLASREQKFDEAYRIFCDHPWTGIGFGMSLSSTDPFSVTVDPVLGIPLSAPVEGGVMYIALPAQVGVIGLIAFLAFLVTFAAPIARYAPLPVLGLCASALFTNAGEYTFFSIGGMGLFLWLFFAFAHRYSADCGLAYEH